MFGRLACFHGGPACGGLAWTSTLIFKGINLAGTETRPYSPWGWPIAAKRRFPSAQADGVMIARQFIGWDDVWLAGLLPWRPGVRRPGPALASTLIFKGINRSGTETRPYPDMVPHQHAQAEFDAQLAAFAAPLNPYRALYKRLVAAGLVR